MKALLLPISSRYMVMKGEATTANNTSRTEASPDQTQEESANVKFPEGNPRTDNQNQLLSIYQARYGWMRDEILMRLEYRYKLTSILLTFIPAILGFIWISGLFSFSFFGSFFILIIALLFLTENQITIERGDYLYEIERNVDELCNVPLEGWEQFSRRPEMEKTRATKKLLMAFSALFYASYSIFNMIGFYYLSLDPTVTITLFMLSETLMIIIIYDVMSMYANFWRGKK